MLLLLLLLLLLVVVVVVVVVVVLHYSASASFRAMASPISFLQPHLFPAAEFMFCIRGKIYGAKDQRWAVLNTVVTELSGGLF